MRSLLLILFVAHSLVGTMAFGGGLLSEETHICINNATNQPHLITVANIENYDWDGDSRPDKNFNNVTIQANSTLCQREERNVNASKSKFTFLIDGTPHTMMYLPTMRTQTDLDEFYYFYRKWGVFRETSSKLEGKETIWFQPSDWWAGYQCEAGANCALFYIR